MSPDKVAEIAALLERTSPQMAARLLTMFERMKVKGAEAVPAEALLRAIRDSGVTLEAEQINRTPGFDRLFWTPFECLLEEPSNGSLLPGSIPRKGLAACWELLVEEIVPDLHKELDTSVRLASLRGDWVEAEELVARFRAGLVDRLTSGPGVALLAESADAQPVGNLLPDLLVADAALSLVPQPWVSPLGELTQEAEGALASEMIGLEGQSAQAAALFALLLMSRLKRPPEVFRVIKNASRNVDDRKLDQTEFSVLGHRLLAQARRLTDSLSEAALGREPFDAAGIACHVSDLTDLATGLERSDILDVHGPWRHELVAIRKLLADRSSTICQRSVQLLQRVLPVDTVRVKGVGMLDQPRFSAAIDEKALSVLTANVGFVAETRFRASLAGFASQRDKADKELKLHLDTIGNRLLALRSKPDASIAPQAIEAWRTAFTSVIAALDGAEAASLFARRLAA
jgi:hypothetical protein